MIVTDSRKLTYYGGDQSWFSYRFLKNYGCGVISAAEVLFGLRGRKEISKLEYMDFADHLWKHYLPVIPGFGMNGLTLAVGLNRYFWKNEMPYFAFWCISGRKLQERAREMIRNGIPVILSIGPNFPILWGNEKLTFYRKENGSFVASARTKAHFVTVTDWERQMIRISSWGKEYYIDAKEYEAYVKKHSSFFVSNMIYIGKKRGVKDKK